MPASLSLAFVIQSKTW